MTGRLVATLIAVAVLAGCSSPADDRRAEVDELLSGISEVPTISTQPPGGVAAGLPLAVLQQSLGSEAPVAMEDLVDMPDPADVDVDDGADVGEVLAGMQETLETQLEEAQNCVPRIPLATVSSTLDAEPSTVLIRGFTEDVAPGVYQTCIWASSSGSQQLSIRYFLSDYATPADAFTMVNSASAADVFVRDATGEVQALAGESMAIIAMPGIDDGIDRILGLLEAVDLSRLLPDPPR